MARPSKKHERHSGRSFSRPPGEAASARREEERDDDVEDVGDVEEVEDVDVIVVERTPVTDKPHACAPAASTATSHLLERERRLADYLLSQQRAQDRCIERALREQAATYLQFRGLGVKLHHDVMANNEDLLTKIREQLRKISHEERASGGTDKPHEGR